MIALKYIDPENVKFKGIENIEQDNGLIFENSHFEIKLPNGENVILTVDRDGNDMSCNFVDEEGKSQEFLLTPRMQDEIKKNALNGKIAGNIDIIILQEALFPTSQEDMEKEIKKDTLVPNEADETIRKIKEKNPNADVKKVVEEKEEEKGENKNLDKNEHASEELDEEEKGDEKIQLPEEVKSVIEQIKESEGEKLKHVLLTKNPASVSEQLIDSASLKENGEPVYCLSFRRGDLSANDRVIFVQGDKVIDDNKYYKEGSDFMNRYRNSNVVENVKDMDSKVIYTDLDKHTFVADMVREPRDLRKEQKEDLDRKLNELKDEEEKIKNSDKPLEVKLKMLKEINDDRIAAFNGYGLDLVEIRKEIQADNEIINEIQDDVKEEKAKREEEQEADDGTDPRETKHERGERSLYKGHN